VKQRNVQLQLLQSQFVEQLMSMVKEHTALLQATYGVNAASTSSAAAGFNERKKPEHKQAGSLHVVPHLAARASWHCHVPVPALHALRMNTCM
jgi:hypothetical protein